MAKGHRSEIKKERNYDFLIREIDDKVEQLLAYK